MADLALAITHHLLVFSLAGVLAFEIGAIRSSMTRDDVVRTWAKMGAFVIVGLLSIGPTVALIRWRRATAEQPGFSPAEHDLRNVRRFLWAEAGFFALIPAFAAAMARGYGMP